MIFVFILPPTSAADAACFFKPLTSCSSSALRFCSCSTARSSFWSRSDSEGVCAPSRGTASKIIAARLTPAARKTNFLVNIRFLLFGDEVFESPRFASSKHDGSYKAIVTALWRNRYDSANSSEGKTTTLAVTGEMLLAGRLPLTLDLE